MYVYSPSVRTVYTVLCMYIHLCVCMSGLACMHVCAYPSFLDILFNDKCNVFAQFLFSGEQTCTDCTCQPCTQGEHVALFLLLVLLVVLFIVVVYLCPLLLHSTW